MKVLFGDQEYESEVVRGYKHQRATQAPHLAIAVWIERRETAEEISKWQEADVEDCLL